MEIVAIGDEHTVTGFRLAGITRAYETEGAAKTIKEILAEENVGVVIMTERFAEAHRSLVEEHKASKRIMPIIVEVPDSAGPITREVDPIRELIRRAIGTDVK